MAIPRVLIAPDKFKGSLTGAQVASAVALGIQRERPDAEVVRLPVADGGDGTLDAAVAAGFERVEVIVSGPTGEPVRTAFARRGSVAVIEMADACGLVRLPNGRRDPMGASSRGLGEVIVAALDSGCRELVIGIGGSASTDGGAGLIQALGAQLIDADDQELPAGGGSLARLERLDLTDLHPGLVEADVVVACDVDNPLTGERGAAAVYGPQKGASTEQVRILDAALDHWADVVVGDGIDLRNHVGAGAAGGVGFVAIALLQAQLRPGIELMLDLLDFEDHLIGVDLVITGEGSLDRQSLHGKAPIGVAQAARRRGIPVVAVCGRRLLNEEELAAAGFDAAYSLVDIEADPGVCMAYAAELLEELGRTIAGHHLAG